MDITNIKKELEEKLANIYEFFIQEVGPIRGARPTPALVEDIQIDYYGQKVPIKQLGSITIVLPREIQISVWDANAVGSIVKEVSARLGVNAANDGNVVHVNLPLLTSERKNELLKIVKAKAEEARIKSRTVRDEVRKAVGEMEKSGKITQDEKYKLDDEIQKIMDDFNNKIDLEVDRKTAEINE